MSQLSAALIALVLGTAFTASSASAAESAPATGKLHGCLPGKPPPGVKVHAIALTSPNHDDHMLALDGACFSSTLPQATYLVRASADGLTGQAPLVRLGDDAQVTIRLIKKDGSNPELAAKLRAMAKADQDVRINHDFNDPAAMRAMEEVDKKNEAALRDIFKTYGWPSADLVGYEGVGSCWILTQHAPYDIMNAQLPAMKLAAERGELMASSVALTIDRVLVREGKKQLYGSQFKQTAAGLEPDPIEDPEHLDERRAQMGLGPFEEYRAALIAMNSPAKK